MILNSFQYNGLTYFRKEEKKNGIGNSISAVLSLGNWFISDDHEYFILDVNSFVAKYRRLISQEQIHLGEIHIFTPFL